jgi:crotonobetainyl-CoA:carnitine CoA-transferase CaiB-like acyl-CoA transferase
MLMDGSRNTRARPGPPPATALDGVRVLDLSSLYAGPLIATTLGDYGADVVKVEHPRGDDARRWGVSKGDVPLWWKVIARNKQLICLDLNREDDRAVARELCTWADVVIENFRPGRMEQWGLGYEDIRRINPRAVMVRVTGFGQFGPYRDQPGFGTLAEALSGFAHITGQPDGPPTLPPFGLADGVAALTGTYAVLMALYWRDALGGNEGQYIDVSLYEPLFSILGPQITEYTQVGRRQERTGNRSPRTAPRNAYRTSDDRWVVLSAGTQQIADRVFEAIDRPESREDPRFSSARARVANADAVDALVSEWIGAHTLAEVRARFAEVEAPLAPVYSIDQILEDPHYRERQSFVEVPDEDLGSVAMQNVVPRLSRTPGTIRWTGHTRIGADTAAVLQRILGRRAADLPRPAEEPDTEHMISDP